VTLLPGHSAVVSIGVGLALELGAWISRDNLYRREGWAMPMEMEDAAASIDVC